MAVRSEAGHGSAFFFSADFGLPHEPAAPAVEHEELHGLAVLVVDDSTTNGMILEELLSSWGMTPNVVNSGDAALAELARAESADESFALALLDVMMPDMDGFALAACIRQRQAQQKLSILMLNSPGHRTPETDCESMGISDVLLKPTKQSDLLRAITNALGITCRTEEDSSPKPIFDLLPRKVLLVEDNAVNQKVAAELLGRRGHSVELALNGAEAVDATARQAFDIVLMDIHMPVMDGLAATRRIRERELASGGHVKIVALTAGATVEDRENSRAAGMDGFVTKPFRAAEIYHAVEGVSAGVLDRQAPPRINELLQAVEVQACLDWNAALRNLEGDEGFLCELCQMFLTQCPALLAAVEEAVIAQDADELMRTAHAMKGSAQVIGARATAAVALQLEALGRDRNLTAASIALADLQAHLEKLKIALEAALQLRET